MLDLIVYGAIQGVAEFLPISSSAHLALLPYFLKIEDPGVAFDLMMHLGTLLAILIYFKVELFGYFRHISFRLFNLSLNSKELSFNRNIFIGTTSTILFVLIFKNIASTYGRDPKFIIFNLVFFGVLMWLFDRKNFDRSQFSMEDKLHLKHSSLIGLLQGIAIFPGISRSGATIFMGRLLGLSRGDAAKFSFFLSIPVIILGAISKIPEVISPQSTYSISDCVIGIIVSFVVGIITIHFFMKLIKKVGLLPFTIYRIILASLLFYYFFY